MSRVCRYSCSHRVIFCHLTLSNLNFGGTQTFDLRQICKNGIVFYAFHNVMDSYWHFVIYFNNGHKYIKWLLFIVDYLQIMTFPLKILCYRCDTQYRFFHYLSLTVTLVLKRFGNSFVSTLVSDFNQSTWSASIYYEQEIAFINLKMKNKNSLYV